MRLEVVEIFNMSSGQTFIVTTSDSKSNSLLELPTNTWFLFVNGDNKKEFSIVNERLPFFKNSRWHRVLVTDSIINRSDIDFDKDEVILMPKFSTFTDSLT